MANNPLYNKLVERVFSERPDLAPYIELFQEAGNAGESVETEKRKQNVDMRLRKLNNAVRVLEEDLEDAMNELDLLAAALGACEECWGEDHQCAKCHGKGSPGFYEPNKKWFSYYVMPALKRASWLEINERKI